MNLKRILELDAQLTTRLRVAERPGILRTLASFFAHSGDSWFWWAGLLLLWWLGNPFWKSWALAILVAIIALAVIVLAIKFSIRRRRPEGEWGAMYRKTDPHSFPSGHAARAFLIAMLVSGLGPGWLVPVIWAWALLVAVARVAMGVHYVSDIAAGIVLGLIAGGIGLSIER